jgi:hypothetical protein
MDVQAFQSVVNGAGLRSVRKNDIFVQWCAMFLRREGAGENRCQLLAFSRSMRAEVRAGGGSAFDASFRRDDITLDAHPKNHRNGRANALKTSHS